jgi:hypothetical protein
MAYIENELNGSFCDVNAIQFFKSSGKKSQQKFIGFGEKLHELKVVKWGKQPPVFRQAVVSLKRARLVGLHRCRIYF